MCIIGRFVKGLENVFKLVLVVCQRTENIFLFFLLLFFFYSSSPFYKGRPLSLNKYSNKYYWKVCQRKTSNSPHTVSIIDVFFLFKTQENKIQSQDTLIHWISSTGQTLGFVLAIYLNALA